MSPCRVTSLSPGLVIIMGITCGQLWAICGNRVDKLSSYTGGETLSPGYPHPLCTKICLANWEKKGFPQYPQDLLLLLQIVRARSSENVSWANFCGKTGSVIGRPLSEPRRFTAGSARGPDFRPRERNPRTGYPQGCVPRPDPATRRHIRKRVAESGKMASTVSARRHDGRGQSK